MKIPEHAFPPFSSLPARERGLKQEVPGGKPGPMACDGTGYCVGSFHGLCWLHATPRQAMIKIMEMARYHLQGECRRGVESSRFCEVYGCDLDFMYRAWGIIEKFPAEGRELKQRGQGGN